MTTDDVRKRLQYKGKPDFSRATAQEICRLLKDELPYLILSGRAYQEMEAISQLMVLLDGHRVTVITQALLNHLYERCLLLITIGVTGPSVIKGRVDLCGDYHHNGITAVELEELVCELLGPIVQR
jgi:hypothetical protein